MEQNDPKQVIIEFLSSPPGELIEPGTPVTEASSGPSVPQAEVRKPGGFSAKVESIQFRKERVIPQRQVYAVTFDDEKGMQYLMICSMIQKADGQWFLASAGGGGGSSDKDSWRGSRRSHAWANLAGGGWEDHFWAGGYVYDNGTPVAKVRLTSSNGQTLEDAVQDDLVLFVTDQKIQVPVEVELYGLSGELVGEHSLFEHHGSHSQALDHPETPDEEKG